ncbi:MAG: LPS assembly lipoprotein LptE [Lysobacteraceae bacterium]
MILRRIPLSISCICMLALAGCGFHPRAELAIPADLGPVKIVSSDPYSPLADSLSRALTRSGTQPAVAPQGCNPLLPATPASPNSAAIEPVAGALPACPGVATLRIVSETWDQGPLSVDSFSHVREYIITYTVKFAFVDANNVDIDPLQDVKLQRDFTYDDSHALGSSEEQSTIREEMQRDMAASIMRRIGIALRNHAF